MTLTTTFINTVKTSVKNTINSDFTHVRFRAEAGGTNQLKARSEIVELGASSIVSAFLGTTEGNSETFVGVDVYDAATGSNTQQTGTFDSDIAKTSAKQVYADIEVQYTVSQ